MHRRSPRSRSHLADTLAGLLAVGALGHGCSLASLDGLQEGAAAGGASAQSSSASGATAGEGGGPGAGGGSGAVGGGSAGGGTAGSGGALSAYGELVLSHPALLSYWRLGEAAPPTAEDSGPAGVDGVYVGGFGFGVPGAVARDPDTAANFVGGYVSIGDAFDFAGDAPFSIELWIAPQPNAYDRVISKTDDGSGYRITFNVDLDLVFSRIENDVFSSIGFTLPGGSGFHHIVGTFDGASICIYLNALAKCVPSPQSLPDTTGPLYFGADSNGTNIYSGKLDEVAFYSAALDEDTIVKHYTAGAQ